MDKRIRSPNYPALSLPEAIAKVETLYNSIHTHSAPREVAAKGMGYSSLNGASATAISALHKYGLLVREGEQIKISDRALRILIPHGKEEKADAIREAAREPTLFGELAERFPGKLPNEELLRNYLLRRGFAPAAVPAVVLAYRETSELVARQGGGHDSGSEPMESPPMQSANSSPPTRPTQPAAFSGEMTQRPSSSSVSESDEQSIVRYDFVEGGYIRIATAGGVDIEEALDVIDALLALKRKELQRKRSQRRQQSTEHFEDEKDA